MPPTQTDHPVVDYASTLDLADAAAMIRAAASIVVLTHAKPDGDAMGSVVSLVAGVRALGVPVEGILMPPVPTSLMPLIEDLPVRVLASDAPVPPADLYVIVDTGAYAQIGPAARAAVDRQLQRTLILDHHLSGDIPAAHRHIEGDAAACAEIIAELLDHLADKPGLHSPDRRTGRIGTRATDWQNPLYSSTVRRALFAAIASDTGWFRFSNTRPRTHELAARLIRMGVDHAELYAQLEQNERPQKLQLMIRALDSLELLAGGRVAIMTLRARDFLETGALLEETERFVDLPQMVETVQVVVLITEPPPIPPGAPGTPGTSLAAAQGSGEGQGSAVPGQDGDSPPDNGSCPTGRGFVGQGSQGEAGEALRGGQTRLSFRSKPGPNAVNVARLAEQFGGGGHARAAGAKLDEPVSVVQARVREAVQAFFR